MTVETDTLTVLHIACTEVGLDSSGAEAIRLGENAIYRLDGGVVARIARTGQASAAAKEVRVARWLEDNDVPAVQVLPDIEQPIQVHGQAVTFWQELPPHKHGTPVQVAALLRRLHALAPPTDFELPPLAPFVRLTERIERAHTLDEDDRAWMRKHLTVLENRYIELPAALPPSVVHGDAWVGNVVHTAAGRVVLVDLERFSLGPPEWDLVSTAIKYTSFAWVPAEVYGDFVRVYGHDVTAWAGFETLRDIREFRMTCMAAQLAAENPATQEQAAHRIACLRGERGPRPWPGWRGVP